MDKINVKNLKYLLSQYKYIFVAARYINNISSSDVKKLAKDKSEDIHNIYDKSVVQGYNIVQNEVKNIYKNSNENLVEIKQFIKYESKSNDSGNDATDEPASLFKHIKSFYKSGFKRELDKEKVSEDKRK